MSSGIQHNPDAGVPLGTQREGPVELPIIQKGKTGHFLFQYIFGGIQPA
jgi:hypothetical protein